MDYGIVAVNLSPVYDPVDVTLCVACLRLCPSPFPMPKLKKQTNTELQNVEPILSLHITIVFCTYHPCFCWSIVFRLDCVRNLAPVDQPVFYLSDTLCGQNTGISSQVSEIGWSSRAVRATLNERMCDVPHRLSTVFWRFDGRPI